MVIVLLWLEFLGWEITYIYIYILPYMDRCITNSISRFTGEVDIGNNANEQHLVTCARISIVLKCFVAKAVDRSSWRPFKSSHN